MATSPAAQFPPGKLTTQRRFHAFTLAFAVLAAAQTPLSLPIGTCTTGDATEGTHNENTGQSKYKIPSGTVTVPGFSVPIPGSLCSEYAIAGWEEPMKLYLGEGSAPYRDLIEVAVAAWNHAIHIPYRKPVIEIVDTRPAIFHLPSSFWSDVEGYGRANLRNDDESVIYFKPSQEGETSVWGTTWFQWFGTTMKQADVYINTKDEESQRPGDLLVLTKKLIDVDDSHGAYALTNKTYSVILHELGHAIGLGHIPVNGNVMSREFGAGGTDQWVAALALELFNDPFPRRNRFVNRHSMISRYMSISPNFKEPLERVEFFTKNAQVGNQEKTALACIYQY